MSHNELMSVIQEITEIREVSEFLDDPWFDDFLDDEVIEFISEEL